MDYSQTSRAKNNGRMEQSIVDGQWKFYGDKETRIYQKVNDPKRFVATRLNFLQGDCKAKSIETWLKMRQVGAVRKRGKRPHVEGDDPRDWHYWVENKGKVFDLSGGVTQIVDLEGYYKGSNMQQIQTPTCGCLFEDELDDLPNSEKDIWKWACETINPQTTKALQIWVKKQLEGEEAVLKQESSSLEHLRPEQMRRMCSIVCDKEYIESATNAFCDMNGITKEELSQTRTRPSVWSRK